MAKYVDGFVLVVPKGKEEEYKEMGEEKSRSFPEIAGASGDENVWFSFIIFNSKEHRDEVNKKVMDEMNEIYKDEMNMQMPFDATKMAYGGFVVAVEG